MVSKLDSDGEYGRNLLSNLDKALNNYENKLFASKSTSCML